MTKIFANNKYQKKEEKINIDIMKRFLAARQNIDANAKALYQCLEYQRDDIDAVVLDMDNLSSIKTILESSELSYYLLDIENRIDGEKTNNLVLIYPNEQREIFFGLQDELSFGGRIVEYKDFSYSESMAMKDFLKAADVKYIASADNDGKIKFMASEKDEEIIAAALRNVQDEIPGNEDYFISKNICWGHAIEQASNVINYDGGPAFIGREGGTGGIKLDEYGAVVMTTKGSRFISRNSKDFDRKVVNAILNDIDGASAPVNVFYGDIVNDIAGDMTRRAAKENVKIMTKKQALSELELESLPDFLEIGKMLEDVDGYSEQKKEALYSLTRMVICREQTLEDIKEYKVSKADKQKYMEMHEEKVNAFAEKFGEKEILIGDISKEEERRDDR